MRERESQLQGQLRPLLQAEAKAIAGPVSFAAMATPKIRLAMTLRPLLDRLQLPGTVRVVERLLRGSSGTVEVRLSTGVRMIVDLDDRVQRLEAFRAYEPHELAMVMRLLEPGDVFIDAGAHVGYFALHAAARVGPHGRIHAFEPVPANARRLRENVAINGFPNVAVNQSVVCETDGTVTLQTIQEPGESGWASIAIDPGERTSPIQVKSTSLDSYLAREPAARVSLIKIDVQGAELDVLRGGAGLLARDRPRVLCEVSEIYWGSQQTTVTAELLTFMRQLDYTPFRIETRRRTVPLTRAPEPGSVANVLFLPRGGQL